MGDVVRLGLQDGLPYYTVVDLAAGERLVLRSVNPTTGEQGETWAFYLIPQGSRETRLVVRHRTPFSREGAERVINGIFEPVSFVMEHRMLQGIRDRAERMAVLEAR